MIFGLRDFGCFGQGLGGFKLQWFEGHYMVVTAFPTSLELLRVIWGPEVLALSGSGLRLVGLGLIRKNSPNSKH